MLKENRLIYLKSPETSEFEEKASKSFDFHVIEVDPLRRIDDLVNKVQELAEIQNQAEADNLKYRGLEAKFRAEKGWKLTAYLNEIKKEGFTDDQIASAFLNTGKYIYLIDNLENLKVDHREIALKLIQKEKGRLVIRYLEKFNVDHREMAKALIEAGFEDQVLRLAHKFNQLKLIDLEKMVEVAENERVNERRKATEEKYNDYVKEWNKRKKEEDQKINQQTKIILNTG